MTGADRELAEVAETVRVQAALLLPADGVRFVINKRPAAIVPELGLGGSCFEAGVVSLDTRADINLANEVHRQLVRYTAAHELHHAARWRSVGCGRRLEEALVSEGLADHFARQLVPTVVAPWTKAMPRGSHWACRLQLPFVLRRERYCRRTWFFRGARLRGIPRWAGYSLGFEIVGAFLCARNKKASDCHDVPASAFFGRNAEL